MGDESIQYDNMTKHVYTMLPDEQKKEQVSNFKTFTSWFKATWIRVYNHSDIVSALVNKINDGSIDAYTLARFSTLQLRDVQKKIDTLADKNEKTICDIVGRTLDLSLKQHRGVTKIQTLGEMYKNSAVHLFEAKLHDEGRWAATPLSAATILSYPSMKYAVGPGSSEGSYTLYWQSKLNPEKPPIVLWVDFTKEDCVHLVNENKNDPVEVCNAVMQMASETIEANTTENKFKLSFIAEEVFRRDLEVSYEAEGKLHGASGIDVVKSLWNEKNMPLLQTFIESYPRPLLRHLVRSQDAGLVSYFLDTKAGLNELKTDTAKAWNVASDELKMVLADHMAVSEIAHVHEEGKTKDTLMNRFLEQIRQDPTQTAHIPPEELENLAKSMDVSFLKQVKAYPEVLDALIVARSLDHWMTDKPKEYSFGLGKYNEPDMPYQLKEFEVQVGDKTISMHRSAFCEKWLEAEGDPSKLRTLLSR